MRTAILMVFLLTAVPVIAGQYDDPSFLTGHIQGSTPRDAIPAMNNPLTVGIGEVDYLAEDDLVLGVYLNGQAKAYPENLGWWHEIINDQIGGQFISVTFCPLTGTGLNFNATTAEGGQIELGVSGLLINSNLVMYDRRDEQTLYPQMIFTGINGQFKQEKLELLPVVETTWALWKKMYPNTQVIQRGTGLERYNDLQQVTYSIRKVYLQYPYFSRSTGDYRTNNDYIINFPTTISSLDTRFPTKDMVLGLCIDDQTKAYPFASMPRQAVINDQLGERAVLVIYDRANRTAIPFDRRVGDQVLEFFQVQAEGDLPVEFMDTQTQSRWNLRGEAVAGPLAGQRLRQIPAYNSMWFGWTAYWPETLVWQGEGVVEAPPTAVQEQLAVPQVFSLGQNFPNPFNPSTHIQYVLSRAGVVRLAVYNAAGQKVRSLVQGHRQAGLFLSQWDGRDDGGRAVASGAYLYRLELDGGESLVRTMTLVR